MDYVRVNFIERIEELEAEVVELRELRDMVFNHSMAGIIVDSSLLSKARECNALEVNHAS